MTSPEEDGFIDEFESRISDDETPGTVAEVDDLKTLKYQLLGPSLTKAGQDAVDQSKVRPSLNK